MMKQRRSRFGSLVGVGLALLAPILSPSFAAAEDEDALVVRYACLLGGRGEVKAPTSAGVLSRQELSDFLLEWDPESDNEEVRRVFALNDLGELARQASQLPLAGGSVSGVYTYGDSRYEIGLEVRPAPAVDADGEAVKITAEIQRDGEVLSRPTIFSAQGERSIVITATGEDAPLLFLVVEVDRVSRGELWRRGLRQSWRKDHYLVDGEEVTAPVPVEKLQPPYPEEARKAKYQGKVVLRLMIDAAGTVEAVEAIEGQPYGLTEAAVEAARSWRFRPALLRGEPVAVVYVVTVNFRLE